MRHLLVLIGITTAILFSGCGLGGNDDGYHRGKITDVSKSGWLCSTYEGQVMSGSGNSSVKYEFTIESKDIYEKLKVAQQHDREVNLHYYSPRIYSICSSSFPNIVDGVEEVEAPNGN